MKISGYETIMIVSILIKDEAMHVRLIRQLKKLITDEI